MVFLCCYDIVERLIPPMCRGCSEDTVQEEGMFESKSREDVGEDFIYMWTRGGGKCGRNSEMMEERHGGDIDWGDYGGFGGGGEEEMEGWEGSGEHFTGEVPGGLGFLIMNCFGWGRVWWMVSGDWFWRGYGDPYGDHCLGVGEGGKGGIEFGGGVGV